ncbi:Hypothetical predicted protein [Marmota monax]|uniref:Uncharacterized protein n=1 Tax=Marmota monax TaxID=9995 RepID=A0A5E4BPG8_MARMO|nr:hypothetical protein GHT09_004882 [Marmota monax]VTJ71156.1 Hypothetical predicted protein [Marmota monax]
MRDRGPDGVRAASRAALRSGAASLTAASARAVAQQAVAASALPCCVLPVSGIHATKERGTRDKKPQSLVRLPCGAAACSMARVRAKSSCARICA